MTTNPSTGLPEELEKISRLRAGEVAGAGDYEKCQAVINSTIDDVRKWACKEVCWRCAEGIPLDRRGKYHIITREVFTTTATCAASVLREGLR